LQILLQVLAHHLSMLEKVFSPSTLVMHLHLLSCELLGAWSHTTSCSSRAEEWIRRLVQSQTASVAIMHHGNQSVTKETVRQCIHTATAAAHMLSHAKGLMDAGLYHRASVMMATAQAVDPGSVGLLHRALQGRILLSNAIVTSAADSSHPVDALVQQALDCFQAGLALLKLYSSSGCVMSSPLQVHSWRVQQYLVVHSDTCDHSQQKHYGKFDHG
jgi:hypothetical protein